MSIEPPGFVEVAVSAATAAKKAKDIRKKVMAGHCSAWCDSGLSMRKYCISGGKLYYRVDTLGGSSGSPVGLKATKSVVAVHTTGFSQNDLEQCNSGVTIAGIKKVSRVLSDSKNIIFNKANNRTTNGPQFSPSRSNLVRYAHS